MRFRTEPVELIHPDQFEELREEALASPRLRAIRPFHLGLDDNPHRFLNGILRGSYVAPHRHQQHPKAESFVVLEGEAGVVEFDDSGRQTACHRLLALGGTHPAGEPRPACGIDLLPGRWHSIVALSAFVVIFEVKPGPYVANTDKEFASWAPREGDARQSEYLAWMESLFRRS